MLSTLTPTINLDWTQNLAATHGLMSHYVDHSNISKSSAKLMPSRSGSNLVPIVEIPVRKPRPVIDNGPSAVPLRAPSLLRPRSTYNVVSSSSSTHGTIALPRLPSIQSRPGQEEWTLEQVQAQAIGRLRPIQCPWSGCDALLASRSFFRKHIDRHIKQVPAQEATDIPRCPWGDCKSVLALGFVHDLNDHVKHVHLPKVKDAYCPFKSCPNPELPLQRTLSHNHFTGPGHTHPWNDSSLRPYADRKHAQTWPRPPKPPPIDPSWQVKEHPFLVNVYPWIPLPKSEPLQAKTRHGKAEEEGPRLQDLVHPIVSDRSDQPFWPTRGEAPSGWTMRTDAISSSIFRHPCFQDPKVAHDYMDGIEITIETDLRAKMLRQPTEPAGDSPFDGMFPEHTHSRAVQPLVPRPRPERRGLQLLPDAEMFNWALDRKRKRVEPVDRKGKGEALDGMEVDQPETTFEPYPRDLVVRASKRLAMKNTGWSVGLGHWRERLYFERKGQQLAELPEWHQV